MGKGGGRKTIIQKLELFLDNCSIRKKFYYLYILCILLPLVITDSMVVFIFIHSDRAMRYKEMKNAADAVSYYISSTVEEAALFAKRASMNRYINEFLNHEYADTYDYVTSYYDFFKGMRFENNAGPGYEKITMYSDNDTIVNGGEFARLDRDAGAKWYERFKRSDMSQMVLFDYDTKRRLMFLQKLNFFDRKREKLLRMELDYAGINRYLKKMNYSMDIFLCWKGNIVLSNGKYASQGLDFSEFREHGRIGYQKKLELYGTTLEINVMHSLDTLAKEITKHLPVIGFLVVANAVLPIMMMQFLNRSFTARLGILSSTFGNVDEEEDLAEIQNIRGTDEIGNLMLSYNKMASRINTLIRIVYRDRIKEQEITVARQRAELLALRSQINPHFLFNALESIRMHSVLKGETETADLIEKLAVLQRQYADWNEGLVSVEQEMEFVKIYLSIQKYRFSDRLSYELEVDETCRSFRVPKLSIVTFVENACVHGIESKMAAGWIFVRVYKKESDFYIEIEDTGKGMDKESMEMLLWKMRNASIGLLQEKERVGMINACLRLKMETNGEAEFELDGEAGLGLMVQVKIPCQCWESEVSKC
ncbi:MAG: histidine kinase [Eubacterium sp.]|nr:histidine kinase [Eubacterium sp.]